MVNSRRDRRGVLNMGLGPFLKKEAFWAKRRVALLVFLFFLLPLIFSLISFSFQESVPRDIPVTVVPRDENIPSDDLEMIKEGIEPFSSPRISRSKEKALDSLKRESTYLVVEVPSNLKVVSDEESLIRIYVDGGLAPVQKSSEYLLGLASDYLQKLPISVDLDLSVIGEEKSVSTFLLPSFLLLLFMILALMYLPYNLSEDEKVLDRLEVDSSWGWMIAGKIGFFTFLLFVPILVFHGVTQYFGASVQVLSPGSILFYVLTFVYLSCIGLSITFISNFTNWGRILNIVLMSFFVTFSSLFYPIGFFGSTIQGLSNFLPTSYSMIAIRGFTLKGMGITSFLDWLGIVSVFTIFSIFLLKGSMELYRRRN